MKANNNTPCHHCTERHEGCHGTCERYKEFRAKLDAENNERIEQFQKSKLVARYIAGRRKYKK